MMIYVFLSNKINHNIKVTEFLNRFDLDYKLMAPEDIDLEVLNFCMQHTENCFDFLKDSLSSYQNRADISYTELCQLILSDVEHSIKLPLVINDDKVYGGISSADEASILLPSKIRVLNKRHYLQRALENDTKHLVGVV